MRMTLEDLKRLDDEKLSRVLVKLSRDQFALAIKAVDEEFRDRWYGCISEKARAMIQEDHRKMMEVTYEQVSWAVLEVLEMAEGLFGDAPLDSSWSESSWSRPKLRLVWATARRA